MTESRIQSEIALVLGSHPDVRLWRNNVAQAWVGHTVHRTPETITLRHYRPLHAGLCTGSSDLIGFRRIEIADRAIAQFLGIEVKSKRGTESPDQIRFRELVNRMGGLAIVARSQEEALDLVIAPP